MINLWKNDESKWLLGNGGSGCKWKMERHWLFLCRFIQIYRYFIFDLQNFVKVTWKKMLEFGCVRKAVGWFWNNNCNDKLRKLRIDSCHEKNTILLLSMVIRLENRTNYTLTVFLFHLSVQLVFSCLLRCFIIFFFFALGVAHFYFPFGRIKIPCVI